MRDQLDTHVAERFLTRFGLAVGLNEILYLEREIASGSCQRVGVQEAVEPGNGLPGHRERHIYRLLASGPRAGGKTVQSGGGRRGASRGQ
jgi:hypothetical protein